VIGAAMIVVVFAAALVVCVPFHAAIAEGSQASAKQPTFKKDILPILERNCLRCHGSKRRKGGLDLSTSGGVLGGGEGGPGVATKQAAGSKLYEMVHKGEMPLDRRTKVSAAEMETIRLWISNLGVSEKLSRPAPQLNQHDIIPIMLRHCTTCHNHRRREGGLDLRTRAAMLRGGKSGPALVPGEPAKSLMLQKILAKQMPPLGVFDTGVTPPPEAEIEKLKRWIAQGAPEVDVRPDVAGTQPEPLVSDRDRQFWAFRSPRPVEPARKVSTLASDTLWSLRNFRYS